MAAIKLTFDGSLNTAKQDAFFNYYLTNKQNGIVKGLGSEIKASSANGTITLSDGFVSIYGRRVFIENGSSIKISLDSTKYGYVILSVNTASNEVSIEAKEGTSSAYPSLTQTDLLNEDGIFELALCSYYKTTSSLTIGTAGVTYVRTIGELLDTLDTSLTTKINAIQNGMQGICIARRSQSGVKQTYDLSKYSSKSDVIIHFNICGFLISTSRNLIASSSYGVTAYYYYLGSWYTVIMTITSSNILSLNVGASTHDVKNIFINY